MQTTGTDLKQSSSELPMWTFNKDKETKRTTITSEVPKFALVCMFVFFINCI